MVGSGIGESHVLHGRPGPPDLGRAGEARRGHVAPEPHLDHDRRRIGPSLGRLFPHPLIARSEAVFLAAFLFTPLLDDYTETFAEELINEEKIGPNGATDYLSISFSATDYIGHAWGPNSVEAFVPPGFYLDRRKISALRLDSGKVETALANILREVPGVAYAYTRTDLLLGRAPRTEIGEKVQRAFHPTRSGDVVIVQAQFWYLYPDVEAFAAMHGSPYSYDTFVPIIFCGPGLAPRRSEAAVCPEDIAPTLASVLGIKAPSGSVGHLLLLSP